MWQVALYGFPLHHSVSPAMHHAAAAELGLPLLYQALPLEPQHLAGAVANLRRPDWLGANVTLPYKREILALVDEVSPLVASIGAANTIYKRLGRLMAENTDVAGLLRALQRSLDLQPRAERVLVLGAGGAARGAVAALLDAGVSTIGLWNRTETHAAELRQALAPLAERHAATIQVVGTALLERWLEDATLVVNATSVGIDGQSSPLPSLPVRGDGRLFDLVYGADGTPLTRMAQRAGWQSSDGLWMLVYQASAAFVLWLNVQPPEDAMHQAALAALAAREHPSIAGRH